MRRIVVLGAGFAGLWSAAGAARKLDELGVGPDGVEVVVINRTPFHSIRVRNYEADLSGTLVPLRNVLEPIGVRHIEATVTGLDLERRVVSYDSGAACELGYDRLVFALGSRVAVPPIPGLAEYGFSIDTYEDAARLHAHLA
ncbi:MAG: FAD-dependent oxidoreductase, partial [Acetobacteraceae bacterium]|nr:FAD-dependent oxidoreductase [Acetobacteraceae bacterium]